MKQILFILYLIILFLATGCRDSSIGGKDDNTEPIISFVSTFGTGKFESFRSGIETINGTFVMAGTKSDSTGSHIAFDSEDAYVVKASAYGDEIWSKYYGGDLDDGLTSIIETPDGGYVAIGYSYSFNPETFNSDVYLLRIDIDGNMLWYNTFDEGGLETGYSIQIAIDGGFILAGTSDDFTTNMQKMLLIRTDMNGNKLWSHKYDIGKDNSIAFSVKKTNYGGFILAGKAFLGATLGQEDIVILETDQNGNELWHKTIGGSYDDTANDIIAIQDSGYAIVGSIQKDPYTVNDTNMVLIRIDQYGNELFRKEYEGEESGLMGYSIDITSDGGFILAGNNPFEVGDYIINLIKTDEYGNEQWRTLYEGDHGARCFSVQETADNGFIVGGAGAKLDYFDFYDSDALILKTDDKGDVLHQ